jgi:hypothetical protein
MVSILNEEGQLAWPKYVRRRKLGESEDELYDESEDDVPPKILDSSSFGTDQSMQNVDPLMRSIDKESDTFKATDKIIKNESQNVLNIESDRSHTKLLANSAEEERVALSNIAS